jgi:hypothetical protein
VPLVFRSCLETRLQFGIWAHFFADYRKKTGLFGVPLTLHSLRRAQRTLRAPTIQDAWAADRFVLPTRGFAHGLLLRPFSKNATSPLRGPYLWTSPKSADKEKEARGRMNHEGTQRRTKKHKRLDFLALFLLRAPLSAFVVKLLHILLVK